MSDWDDLFAAASGSSSKPTTTADHAGPAAGPAAKKHKSNAAATAQQQSPLANAVSLSSAFRRHITNRIMNDTPLPSSKVLRRLAAEISLSCASGDQNTKVRSDNSTLLTLHGLSCKLAERVAQLKHPSITHLLELLTFLDEIYYNCYYLALSCDRKSSPTPPTSTKNFAKLTKLVPSPVVYFGCDTSSHHTYKSDPLTLLHKHHTETTKALFRKVPLRTEDFATDTTPVTTAKVFNEQAHDTPAPKLLADWRDLHRRWPCHLYSYATVPPPLLATVLESNGDRKFLEYGCGTGYLSNLLVLEGADVVSIDIAVPGGGADTNEYHGAISPFTSVRSGDVDALDAVRDLRDRTLVMSYPCPDNQMGHQALFTFLAAGGERFVHIGEWRGLTGTVAMESLLVEKMKCVERRDCPRWGQDATALTVWEVRKGAEAKKETPLLPCVGCGTASGRYRLGVARDRVYCGAACFASDSPARLALFATRAIPAAVEDGLTFGNGCVDLDVIPRLL
jgi:hypothetical protein